MGAAAHRAGVAAVPNLDPVTPTGYIRDTKRRKIVKALGPSSKRVTRPAWRPVVDRGDGPSTASKFCGMPWTGPKAPRPECGGCNAPLSRLF